MKISTEFINLIYVYCIIRKPYCDECTMNYVSGYAATNNITK